MLEQMTTLQPVEDSRPEQVDNPQRNCGLWRGQTGDAFSQRSVLGPVMFFINGTDKRTEYTFSKFADEIKVSGETNTSEGQDAIQKDLDKLEKWVHGNLMRFNNVRCKVLHLGCANHRYQYRLRN
ncbi:rna-directed dna polymerase from mobile element jockey-like [Willisornis vidua]|uniref:Rna-directed dna polymerase from mobile element jockey-like n=1 Tax=Willisornis vidua TaxID=1566151 RepID=A0ABQ9DTU1_9PASS|nr:rna-directed dna polymerase from mobile element jockey-like [Willisornis vidua]